VANIEITNVDLGSVELEGGQFRDELLTLAGADTIAAGTILARDSVSKKLVLFVKGGSTNENGIPKAVLTYEVTAEEASDVPVRALVAGVVNKNRLVIDEDGDDTNVDIDVLEGLRTFGIVAEETSQLSRHDNPVGNPEDS
jgi:hypothetical protein